MLYTQTTRPHPIDPNAHVLRAVGAFVREGGRGVHNDVKGRCAPNRGENRILAINHALAILLLDVNIEGEAATRKIQGARIFPLGVDVQPVLGVGEGGQMLEA